MCDTCFQGYIRKCSVAVVAEQVRRGFASDRKSFDLRTIHNEDVEPAIIVVVVEGDAASGSFEQILILVVSSKDRLYVQSRFARDIHKVNAQFGLIGCWSAAQSNRNSRSTFRQQPAWPCQSQNAFKRKHETGTAKRFQEVAT